MTRATDSKTDPSCPWTTDSDMVLSHSLGPDDILALGRENGHSGGGWSWQLCGFLSPPWPQVVVPTLGHYVTISSVQNMEFTSESLL